MRVRGVVGLLSFSLRSPLRPELLFKIYKSSGPGLVFVSRMRKMFHNAQRHECRLCVIDMVQCSSKI